MQPETILQAVYLPGKKKPPARAATVMGTRLSTANNSSINSSGSGSVRYRHQHSNSTPPTGIHHHQRAASAVSGCRVAPLRPSPAPPAPRPRSNSTSAASETTTVLIGRQRAPFTVSRRLLCAASPFFRARLDSSSTTTATLWLPGESATMFGLFVEWLHAPRSFRSHLDDIMPATEAEAQLFHWALVRLHLFASHLGLAPLQDLAMDAVQDLYLRRDWDIAPGVVAYLYARCEARHSGRLRRWAVAMVAFSLAVAGQAEEQAVEEGGSEAGDDRQQRTSASHLRGLLAALPELAADYAAHVRGMRAAGLDLRFKNPQLRIPANALRSDKRAFGFRECSFHSHRAAVGQGACPHAASGLRAADTGSMLDLGAGGEVVVEEEDEVDEDDDRRQWEKEWAGEFAGWEDGEEYTYATTSLRRPQPEPLTRTPSGRRLMSKFGTHTPRAPSRDGTVPPMPG